MIAIPPPSKPCRRARGWTTFERLFDPIDAPDGSLLWQHDDLLAADVPVHRVWTVVDTDTGALYALAGCHVVNRVAYLVTANAWWGDANAHPAYVYASLRETR